MISNRRAFTLVELLVVVSIIAMLLGILLPSLSKAREMGKRIQCGSNLHQLTYAWIMYSTDNCDFVMTPKDYNPVASHPEWQYRFWTGAWDKILQTLVPEAGFIWTYAQGKGLRACPSFNPMQNPASYGQFGYGYNFMYLSPQDDSKTGPLYITRWIKLSAVRFPGNKVAFVDCARNQKNPSSAWPQETTPFIPAPSRQYPGFQGRHNNLGNIAWMDGHISNRKPELLRACYNINNSGTYNMLASYAKKLNIGDIDDDGNPDTDELFKPF
jgi:prepilin-type N-terminal cleavage/methylation domain-containing protein/prepilin-type processing-associated H-X9-DG protein